MKLAVMQENKPQVERQSGHCGSGKRIQVYAADMRCRVALQFWPDDYEWSERVCLLPPGCQAAFRFSDRLNRTRDGGGRGCWLRPTHTAVGCRTVLARTDRTTDVAPSRIDLQLRN